MKPIRSAVRLSTIGAILAMTGGSLLSLDAAAFTFDVIHTFAGDKDGEDPMGQLAMDAAGNLYGTTYSRATPKHGDVGGTLFEISQDGFATLHRFKGHDGGSPSGSLLVDVAGNVYGTTRVGGRGGMGTVFKFSAASGLEVLASFSGDAHGGMPVGGLVADAAGVLYGATAQYGDPTCVCGTVFSLDPATRELTTIHSFVRSEGTTPEATLTLVGTSLYGGTAWDGPTFRGTLFTLQVDGSGFMDIPPTNGFYSFESGMSVDAKGNLWGGSFAGTGTYGGLFRIDSANVYHPAYTFTGPPDGYALTGTPLVAVDGMIYGTTNFGGDSGCKCGTIYRFDPVEKTLTTLYSFTGGSDAGYPAAGLIQAADGTMYGVATGEDLPDGHGVVFRITP